MAPFTHDFKKAQQRMPAIPVNIHHVNFTWQATGQVLYTFDTPFILARETFFFIRSILIRFFIGRQHDNNLDMLKCVQMQT